MPISTIHNILVNNKNVCSIDGSPGGNQSPELSWTGAPPRTLTENAGVVGSHYGAQIVNDFLIGAEYDGPCPPANASPDVHRYLFTVYAFDIELELPSSANFPANAEPLYQALIESGTKPPYSGKGQPHRTVLNDSVRSLDLRASDLAAQLKTFVYNCVRIRYLVHH
jgi:hypothetical protein